MHIGSLRTYIEAYDYAKACGEKLAVRFDYLSTLNEDLQAYYESNMLELLQSLDLSPDVVFYNKQSDAIVLNHVPSDCAVYDVNEYRISGAPFYVLEEYNNRFIHDYDALVTDYPVSTRIIVPTKYDKSGITRVKSISDPVYKLKVDQVFIDKMFEVPYPIHKWPYTLNISLMGVEHKNGWKLGYVANGLVQNHLHGVTHVFRGASTAYIRPFMEVEQARILRIPLPSQTIVPTIQQNGRKIRKTGNKVGDDTVVEHLLQIHPDLVTKIRRHIASVPSHAFIDYSEILG